MIRTAAAVVVFASIPALSPALAGPLAPPAGPVSPSYLTLDEIEPRIPLTQGTAPGDSDSVFRITTPGSYILTEQLVVPSSFDGIEIAASDVTIDLNGFRIVGQAGADNGVQLEGFFDRVSARNGFVSSFTQIGINLRGGSTTANSGCVVENITATLCDSAAIRVGTGAVVRHCHIASGAGDGINAADSLTMNNTVIVGLAGKGLIAGDDALVQNCQITDQSGDGANLGANASVHGSVFNSNGIFGVTTGDGLTMSNCQVNGNSSLGLDADNDATVIDSSFNENGNDGLTTQAGANIRGCTANNNAGFGILINGVGGLVQHCTTAFNGTGIFIADRGTVRHCAATGNTTGIRAGASNFIEHNTTSQCTTGIAIIDNGTVQHNHHTGGSTGISVTGNGSVIDSNTVVNVPGTAINIANSGNLIVRNRVRTATVPFGISSGNDVGTIQFSPVGAGAWDNLNY